jgi:DNA polymerase-3 subunit beta
MRHFPPLQETHTMRITIPRADLARIISSTIKAVEARNTIPILSNIMLKAGDGKLTAVATDLDIEIQASTACEVDAAGSITVTGHLLNGIVSKLSAGGEVLLELVDGSLIVKSDRSRFKLQCLPADDFPSLTAGEYDVEFDFDLSQFCAPVAFAISNEETRYYLNGVYFLKSGGKITAVATDGHRLARNEMESDAPDFAGIIIPSKTVSLLPKGTNTVRISSTKMQIVGADFVVTSKLIDGTYPDYQRVIPTGNDKQVTVDNASFSAASDRVATISSERGRAVKLSFDTGRVIMTVNNPDSGNATDEVAAGYEGDAMDVGFNAKYLAEITRVLPNGNFKMMLADGGTPALFLSDAAPNLALVLMPMRV